MLAEIDRDRVPAAAGAEGIVPDGCSRVLDVIEPVTVRIGAFARADSDAAVTPIDEMCVMRKFLMLTFLLLCLLQSSQCRACAGTLDLSDSSEARVAAWPSPCA
jgi:hypothetical protein